MNKPDKIISGVNDYYSKKLTQFGNTANGVDWQSKESQYLRFEILSKVIDTKEKFTILDYGCGTGELFNYLSGKYKTFEYNGYDISQNMIDQAVKNLSKHRNVNFTNDKPVTLSDYIIASGIFNVRLNLANNKNWLSYILKTLDTMNNLSEKGFSFNALTKYSDKEFMKDYLYYADPLFLFNYCKINFSKNVALLHDYNLYEFSIIVRK